MYDSDAMCDGRRFGKEFFLDAILHVRIFRDLKFIITPNSRSISSQSYQCIEIYTDFHGCRVSTLLSGKRIGHSNLQVLFRSVT